LTNKFEEVNT